MSTDKLTKRPSFKDYLPENTTVDDIKKMFGANSNLYKYILALDNYIDQLEEVYSSGLYVVELSDQEIKIIDQKELDEWNKSAEDFDGFVGFTIRGKLLK